MAALPGLDLDVLGAWMDTVHPGLRAGPLRGALLPGGKSNLTYRVDDGRSTWAVRRPPLGHVLPTAHDMAREFRVISALAATDVPVPPPVGLCEDVEILGAPFYVMRFVEGVVLDTPAAIESVPVDAATTLSEQLVDTLAALHAVDPEQVGLADFGRPDGFLARQVARWHKQWQASQTRVQPLEPEVVDLLTQRLPESKPGTVVHGDYRLSNVIVTPALDGIAAILDWEMATLGDPLTDVGLLYVYRRVADGSNTILPRMTVDRGFPAADELARRYGRASGRDLSTLPWYVGFGYFKLAVIAEGIAARFQQGKTVGEGFDRIGEAVPGLLEHARGALAALD